MTRVVCMATAVWIAALTGAISAQTPSSAPAPSAAQKVRVGVFDSRMVALAYYNSDEQRTFMQDLMVRLKAAKAANDAAKIADLEFRGPAVQNLMHYQVFSNASIPNVMEKLAPELPKIAADARVSIIVSKWDVAFHDPNVEYVDVTDTLVARFNPSEKVQKWIDSGKTQQPMPLLEAVMTLRPER
jgi:hypothetical protein